MRFSLDAVIEKIKNQKVKRNICLPSHQPALSNNVTIRFLMS
jgi:hypothetical protein